MVPPIIILIIVVVLIIGCLWVRIGTITSTTVIIVCIRIVFVIEVRVIITIIAIITIPQIWIVTEHVRVVNIGRVIGCHPATAPTIGKEWIIVGHIAAIVG